MMKQKVSKLTALMMAAVCLLSGCSSQTTEATDTSKSASTEEKPAGKFEEKTEAKAEAKKETKEITNLCLSKPVTREISDFNALSSESVAGLENLANCVEGLLEADTYGRVVPCMAESWESEDDSKTWTFHLRDGLSWVDVNGNEKAACTAQDFATGLEWVLNFYKNESANTSMPNEMIKGAKEYYEYTKSLTEEEAFALTAEEGSKFREMVGIETPDERTVTYHCIASKPYFDTVASYACLWPMSQGMVEELGGPAQVKGMDNTNMWYNGPYTITTYVQNNEKVFTKNPKYWDKDCKLFDTVTIRMVESNDVAYQLYQTGEIDYVELTESNLKTIHDNPENPYYDYLVEQPATTFSYQWHFNYNKMKEDGTPDDNWNNAIANEAFRKALYYGYNASEFYTRINTINPMSCENNFYTMKGLVYTSDGTEYTKLVQEKMGLPDLNGEKMVRLDDAKYEQYKKQAIEELTAQGVTFPVEMDYYISASNQVSLDSANVMAQAISNSLGDDFLKLNIKTYVSSQTQEVLNPHLHSITMNGWGADYGDPMNYLGQETYGNDSAYYARTQSNINDVPETENTKQLLDTYKEFTALVEKADAIVDDLDARYEAFAEAEAYMLEHVLVLPQYYNVPWCLTKINLYSKMNAVYGCLAYKMKNWETNADAYTTEEMKAIAEEHLK